MAAKYLKKQEEAKKSTASAPVEANVHIVNQSMAQPNRSSMISGSPGQNMGRTISEMDTQSMLGDGIDICPIHKRKIEIICIDCKERICSQCALFGNHKNHDIRMEQDVLDEINVRSECLMEMYQIVNQNASEKPSEAQVDEILM